MECYGNAENHMLIKMMNDSESEHFSNICNCLPACESIAYNAEISQAKLEYHKKIEAMSPFNHFYNRQLQK